MRIALLQPTYWPEVRRGSERVVHDLGVTLASRGHEVTLVTSHPGRSATTVEEGVRVVRARRPPALPGSGLYEYHLANAANVALHLRRTRYDLVHAFFPVDAWVAVAMRGRGGAPVVATVHGIPTRPYLVARRYRLEMLRYVAAGADECSVLSAAAAAPFHRYLLREPRVLPGGVLGAAFAAEPRRPAAPTLLCPASLGDPRKRAELLFEAFALLRERLPEARLLLAGGRDPVMSRARVGGAEGVEAIEADSSAALAEAYSRATATVLPSAEEAFGLVLVESLAAGVPVVADRTGGAPEIVTGERVGRLFDGGAADLARAMAEALELGAQPRTAGLCRERASAFDWSRVVLDYEAVYESALGSRSTRAQSSTRR